MPDPRIVHSADAAVAWACRSISRDLARNGSALAAGYAAIQRVAADLAATLDPRTPPGDVGRALIYAASQAQTQLVLLHRLALNPAAAITYDASVALNSIAVTGYALIDAAGDLDAVLGLDITTPPTQPSAPQEP